MPLSTWRTAKGQDSAKTDEMKADGVQADAPFKLMAKKYGVTEAQVLLRWAVQKGYPVLPKSTDPERIRKNADIFGFEIDDGGHGCDREDGSWRWGGLGHRAIPPRLRDSRNRTARRPRSWSRCRKRCLDMRNRSG